LGAGFSSMTLTVTGDGTQLLNQTFTTLAQATTWFNDTTQNLGLIGSGSLSASILTLKVVLTITTAHAGDGFYGDIIVGDPPGGSTTAFTQAMAGLPGRSGGGRLVGTSLDRAAFVLASPTRAAIA
ncbi:MAG TPA: hypothetical protein VGS12_09940, partial [Caulobacteraceae bacterium]|nr:hypothetical protein [Caulobacteraceae bacterium]